MSTVKTALHNHQTALLEFLSNVNVIFYMASTV